MKITLFGLFLALNIGFAVPVQADEEPPTYKSDPSQIGKYQTGLAKKVLTFQQLQIKNQFDAEAKAKGWTFEYDVSEVGMHPTGLLPKPENWMKQGTSFTGPYEPMKSFGLSEFGKVLGPILNQGNCGSCVVFSFIASGTDHQILRDIPLPADGLSPQHLMNCGTGMQCNGAFGNDVAGDFAKLGWLVSESDYPYTARTGSCKSVVGKKRWGQIQRFVELDGNPQEILDALHKGFVPSISVAANDSFSSYKSGTYNACNSFSTNHYVAIEEVDCETAVDEKGFCKFDAKGNLPPGVGRYKVRNSWGKGWGDDGYIWMKITDRSGRKCNAIAESGQYLDSGLPLPPKEPLVLKTKIGKVTLTITIAPGSVSQKDAIVEQIKSAIETLEAA